MTALFTLILLSPAAWAGDPMTKLGRGLGNLVTAPLEYPIHFAAAWQQANPFVTVVNGISYGTVMTVARILGGAYEIVTFPIPIPQNYDPLMNPPTALEAFQQLQ